MKGKYYYLISGLPHISLDVVEGAPDFRAFMDETAELVSRRDVELLRLIRLPADNRNLVNMLEKKEVPFDMTGNFSEEELRHALGGLDILPPYMMSIIEAHRLDLPVFHNMTWNDQINWLFHEFVDGMPNAFLKEWFSFELNLGNFLSALISREFNISIERRIDQRIEKTRAQAIIGHNEIAEVILESSAPDLSLSRLLPFVDEILALDRSDLAGFERGIDRIRWEMLDEMTCFDYFDIEVLLVYGLKLGILERWKGLDEVKGGERFGHILAGLEMEGCGFKNNGAQAAAAALSGAER